MDNRFENLGWKGKERDWLVVRPVVDVWNGIYVRDLSEGVPFLGF